MDKRRPRKQAKTRRSTSEGFCLSLLQTSWPPASVFLFYGAVWLPEVSSIEWEFIKMTDQEEDLIYRMYRLVGDRWDLIAGRIPGRKPEEIERFWIMRHGEVFAKKRSEHSARNS